MRDMLRQVCSLEDRNIRIMKNPISIQRQVIPNKVEGNNR